MVDDPIFDRPIVTEANDGIIEFRASSFGYCIGALVRARLGVTPSPPPDLMLERYQESHDFEREVLVAGLGVDWVEVVAESELSRLGQLVDGRNGERQVETTIEWGAAGNGKRVTCHPDAFVRRGAKKSEGELAPLHVCEVKFLGPDKYNEVVGGVERDGMRGLGLGYAWQASIEMLSTGLPLLYIIGQKDRTGADGEVKLASPPIVYEFAEPCFTLKDVKMRVMEVEGWVARGDMPPCPVPFDYPCGYWKEHEAREGQEAITDEKLLHLVESWARNRGRAEAIETEAAAIRADIDARLVEIGVAGGLCGGWEIVRTEARKGNVSWSKAWKALPKDVRDGVDVEQYRGAEVAAGIRLTRKSTDG